jgi:class 3 adenylate cyclase
MEPRIQYAKTSDGVSIAYAAFGDGPTIVVAPSMWGDIHMYPVGPLPVRRVTDGLVERGWRVVCYDGRGLGSSDRGGSDFSLEGRLRDLEAVIDVTGVDHFTLSGTMQGGPVAIAYSVRHPESASRLVLFNSFARGADYYEAIPSMRVARDLRDTAEDQWEFYTLALANSILGFSDSEFARRLASVFRASISPKSYLAYRDAEKEIDVTSLLGSVSVPTLVVDDRSTTLGDFSALAQKLAQRIPGARFVVTEDAAATIDEFLREGGLRPETRAVVEVAPPVALRPSSGTAVILFADIVDSTALTERMGDTAFRDKARELDTALRAIIRENGGTPIEGKLLGDGVLAVFTSARQAIEAALACGRAGDDGGLPLHLGIHAGDVIREGDNVYGGAVNIASRISGLSAPGEVLVSETVRSLARTSAGVGFEDRGEQSLKGVSEPVRVWAVIQPDTQTP